MLVKADAGGESVCIAVGAAVGVGTAVGVAVGDDVAADTMQRTVAGTPGIVADTAGTVAVAADEVQYLHFLSYYNAGVAVWDAPWKTTSLPRRHLAARLQL